MASIFWLIGSILFFQFSVDAQNIHPYSLFSFYKSGRDYNSADFIEQSGDYEIIRDKADLLYPENTARKTLKIRLKNGLEVYLISDPQVEQSAASLAVEVGSWSDPANVPGMAHFVEHLLFMGTRKYPVESDFCKYIGERGGEYNAFTSHDRTVYGFCLNHEGLAGGLDRLSHFFIDPLFSSSTIEREKNAIHHEFEDHIENDSIRIWRVLKETGNPMHPNAVFSCGNLKSLEDVSSKEIEEWYCRHYTAPNMNLVILSSMPLSELTKMAVKFFSPISSEHGKKYLYKEPFTSEKQKGHFIYVNPSYKSRSLQLIWEVPKEFAEGFSMRPMQLVQLALDHQGENSLGSHLEEEDLAKELVVDYWRIEKDHVLFMIEVALTKNGVEHVDDVIYKCFQAINQLKEKGIPYYLYEQLYDAEKQLLNGSSLSNSFDFVLEAAASLIDEELETFPQKMSIPSNYDKTFLNRFVHSLVPESCIFLLMAPERETQIKLNAIEKWMGTSYTVRTIAEERLSNWKHASSHPEIDVRPADYEGRDEIEIPGLEDEEGEEAVSVIDSCSANICLSYVDDETSDSVSAFFCIDNLGGKNSVKEAAMTSLFVMELRDRLSEVFTQEEENSLFWNIISGDLEFYLFLKASGDRKAEDFQTFFEKLSKIIVDIEGFEQVKAYYIDNYSGDPDPLEYAQAIAQSLLVPNSYTAAEIYKTIQTISFDDYKVFSSQFFKKIFVEGVFYGYLSEGDVATYWQLIESCLKQDDCKEGEELPARTEEINWSHPVAIEKETHRKGNALLVVLNIGSVTRENWAIQKILSQLLQDEFFEELRTRQQTAYRLYSWGETFQDRLLQYVAIQSSTHDPQDLKVRVEVFLHDFALNFQRNISKERVNLVRHMLITEFKRQKLSLPGEEANRWLTASIEILKIITYEKICDMVAQVFSSENQKRITVMVRGADQSFSEASQNSDF
ncbi:MAG: insulinase family protein [Chlamydiae bacterium]|nr:insulinase family protein [Chlamydiota bacterium]